MTQFRLTRPDCYEPGCPGHKDPSARQGYYIDADSEEEALLRMKQRFPEDKGFDVQVWKG